MARLLTFKDVESGQHVLIYGAPKTGKTTMIGELSKDYKLLLLDAEDGKDTLFDSCTDEQLANIEYIGIPDSPTNPCFAETLLKMIEERKGYICDEHSEWNCLRCKKDKDKFFQIDLDEQTSANGWIIVIESGTQFSESSFHRICNKNNITLEDGDKASFTIWGMQGVYIKKLLGMVQVAQKNHILATAHEMEAELPDKSKKLVPFIGTSKVAPKVAGYFGHVIRLSRKGLKHAATSTTTAQANVETGSRWSLDINDSNITIRDFFKLPEGHRGGQKSTSATGSKSAAKPAIGKLSSLSKLNKK